MNKCVILSAGQIENYDLMRQYISPGDYVIAADGGLLNAERLGVKPDCILGDLTRWGTFRTVRMRFILPERTTPTLCWL